MSSGRSLQAISLKNIDNAGSTAWGGAAAPPPKVLILGVGNLLLKDDGFGVHFINSLRCIDFPENISLLEAGTVSHQLIPLLHEVSHLIVVDVVRGRRHAWLTVHVFT